MEAGITKFLSEIKIGAKQTHKDMTLYCLLSASEAPVHFLTLDEALEREALVITEVHEGCPVRDLKVINSFAVSQNIDSLRIPQHVPHS